MDLQAFGVKFDQYYLEIVAVHGRPRGEDGGRR